MYEAIGDDVSVIQQQPHCARIETGLQSARGEQDQRKGFSIKGFIEGAESLYQRDEFYRAMRENGNQYGPGFQHLERVWRSGGEVLGRLSAPPAEKQIRQHYLLPTLVDSFTHLLAAFILDNGKSFVLRSIERIELHDIDFPDELWAHGRLTSSSEADGESFIGDVEVFDESGKRFLTLSSVSFDYLKDSAPDHAGAETTLVVSSTFTAEPLEDSIKFWGDYLNVPTNTQFAPYNQIFQELLSSGSAFRKNTSGVNVVLLSLEDWSERKPHSLVAVSKESADEHFKNHSRWVLPNGLEIAHLNEYETSYVYKEIFEDNCYLRHGIQLSDGDTIVDIGVNIGLFSLFVLDHSPNAKLYAFEPSPVVYELLKANCQAYGPDVHTFNCGISDRAKTAEFTFYEKSSVFSGFYANEREDGEAIQTVARNILRKETSLGDESVKEYVDELTADRLHRRTYECRLMSVSDIIRQNGIDRIHLLKIDAEKSELDIIRGIEDCHWPVIDQLVIEVHDRSRKAVEEVERILIGKGYRCAVEAEELLQSSGLYNIYASKCDIDAGEAGPTGQAKGRQSALERNTAEFYRALELFMHQSTVPLILCICPRTAQGTDDPSIGGALDRTEADLLSRCGTLANVHAIASKSILERYPAREYCDAHSHQLGHIPYTPPGYAAIGTSVFRTVVSLKRSPYKVIVLDCDNTLWKGICGEDGPLGVEITPAHRFLQQFMVAQMQTGALICLCSKNNEADVWAVFDKKPDMPLKREHLASSRINWHRKSENLCALASELNLQLDSFILVDDNPVECADVKLSCPGVLTLQLPERGELIPGFLKSVWAFDRPFLTEEDRIRTRMYQENAQRERNREQAFSLREFLDGLQLHIDITEAGEEHSGRMSQLTFRTNQFNFTTIRRSESELRNFLGRENGRGLVVKVSDRFGDYGLVGVVLYEAAADRFLVDTFLLSCRVLGKGVEHCIVRELASRAQKEGKAFVEVKFVLSEKNAPAYEFLKNLGVEPTKDATGASTRVCAAGALTTLTYEPDEQEPRDAVQQADAMAGRGTGRSANLDRGIGVSEKMQRIGDELHDADQIAAAVEAWKLKRSPARGAGLEEAGNDLEAALLDIWRRVLANMQIGIHDNFFEAGGSSLKAVMVIARIKQALK